MISREEPCARSDTLEEPSFECREIAFPPVTRNHNSPAPVIIKVMIFKRHVNRVYMDSKSSCEVIYEHCFLKLKPSIKASKVDSKVPLVGFSGEHSWPIGEVPLEITIGDTPFSRRETLNFVIEASPADIQRILSCTNAEERVIVNNEHPEQTIIIEKQLPENFKEKLRDLLKSNADVFAWTHSDMTGILETIMVGGKPFNTEHKLNEYSHIKPIKQKRRGLGHDRSTSAFKEVEELMKAGI
ncbi:hypothetical protein Tco_0099956 [Tanacetum coccineum]